MITSYLDVPGLTSEARKSLEILSRSGSVVSAYQVHNRWILEIRTPYTPPDHDPRWMVAAWNAYCAGEHPTASDALCMCTPCQHQRQERAWAEYVAREAARKAGQP